MNITFIGATHEVTGSCILLQACGKNILIDCGLEQGQDIYENQEIPVAASHIDAVLLTHAHIDHSGKLPLLYAHGFRGEIHSTGATNSLCDIMLRDSAHIQMFEAEWKSRKDKRSGKEPTLPLYNMEDAISTIKLFVPHEYGVKYNVFEGIEIRFIDVGHLLGSASIEVWITEEDTTKKLVFSGDIGNFNQPLIKDPNYIEEADYVIMESTYGDRKHEKRSDYLGEFAKIIQTTFDRGGSLIIPSFAVGRTQELLYFIGKIKAHHLVKGHGEFKVYLDSPLAIEATRIYIDNKMGYYDEEAMTLVNKGVNPLTFPNLKISVSADESKAINYDTDSKIVISASGMCEAGRIRHHLKHNLWDEKNTILFVGHQARGSLGRIILDGAKEVKLFGETIAVKAGIESLHGLSGHADKDGLILWLKHFKRKPQKVFVVHGESSVCDMFTDYLIDELGYDARAPYSGEVHDLKDNQVVYEGIPVEVEKTDYERKTSTSAFERLMNAGKRLMKVIEKNKNGANKDLARFTGQINSLADKWDN